MPSGKRRNWTREMDIFLYNNYATMPMKELRGGLNAIYFEATLDHRAIKIRAKALGLFGTRTIVEEPKAKANGKPKRIRDRNRKVPEHLLTRARRRTKEQMEADRQEKLQAKLAKAPGRAALRALNRERRAQRLPLLKTYPAELSAPTQDIHRTILPEAKPKPAFSIVPEEGYTEAEQRILAKHARAKELLRQGDDVMEIAKTVGLEGRVVRQLIGEIRREKYNV